MSPQAAPPQVHEQEREVVEDVDARDFIVELDRVEKRRLAVDEHDVTQVKIAVTLPDKTGPMPCIELRCVPPESALRSVCHTCREGRIQDFSSLDSECGGVSVDDPGHAGLASVIGAALGLSMQARDSVGERAHHFEIERSAFSETVEQGRLVEACHLNHPVNGLALTTEGQRFVTLARHGYDTTVQVRVPNGN